MNPLRLVLIALLALSFFVVATPATAQCAPFLCYIDLENGGFICPNSSVYSVLQVHPTVNTPYNPTCNTAFFKAVVVKVEVPPECLSVSTWVEYNGQPEGFSLDIGDSPTNDGFGGDAGGAPVGQNAELQVLDNQVRVYNSASSPAEIEELSSATLALNDGSLKVVVKNQFVSFGQPYQSFSTPDLKRLFYLPGSPAAPDNRTLYVGINRVIAPIDGQDLSRNGCGARRVLISLR